MMKGLAIFHEGFEDVVKEELNIFDVKNMEFHKNIVIFDVNSLEHLCKIAYKSQFALKVGLFLFKSKNNVGDVESELNNLEIPNFLDENMKFALRATKIEDMIETRQEIEDKFGGPFKEKLKMKVDLDKPDVIINSVILNDQVFFSLDLTKDKLEKRPYRIYTTPTDFKATLDYSILRWSGWNSKKDLLNVNAKTGTLVIEATYSALNMSPYYFDKNFPFESIPGVDWAKFYENIDNEIKKNVEGKIVGTDPMFKNINFAKKNAKIGGVEKHIKFSHVETSWLDVKFSEKEFDIIIGKMPLLTKWRNEKDIKKEYRELFYQSSYIGKEKVKVIIITNVKDIAIEEAQKEGFVLEKEKKIKANAYNTLLMFKRGG